MSQDIPYRKDRLMRASLFDIKSLLKHFRIMVGILFGYTALWIFREEKMLEISFQSVGEIKNDSLFSSGRKTKSAFLVSNRERIGYLVQ